MSFSLGLKSLFSGRIVKAAREFTGLADRSRERERERAPEPQRTAREPEREVRRAERETAASARTGKERTSTWGEVQRLADQNINEGEWYSSRTRSDPAARRDRWRYEALYEALETLKVKVDIVYGGQLSRREVENIALGRLYDLQFKASRSYSDYALQFNNRRGEELWNEVNALGLPSSLGHYHGDTSVSFGRHYYGAHTAKMSTKTPWKRR